MSMMHQFWTPDHFRAIAQGRWLIEPTDGSAALQGVSIDSRAITPGQVFVAVRGERFDGHDYVNEALAKGAGLVIVQADRSHADAPWRATTSTPVLETVDTVAALQILARSWRDHLGRSGVKIVAVTGSNGKTTTRQLIHAVLSAKYTGSQSPKSFNNHLGVPLTLLAASREDDFVVAEVGTNHPGEIAPLAQILQPDIAVLTTIGRAHIGHFPDVQAIAREKASLLSHLVPGGIAIVAQDIACREIVEQAVPAHARVVSFGTSDLSRDSIADGSLAIEPASDERTRTKAMMRFSLRSGTVVRLPMVGSHNIANALAALAVGQAMGVSDRDGANALTAMTPPAMRLELQQVGLGDEAVTLINDAYNANPDSMHAALVTFEQVFASGRYKRGVVILGDMLELGDEGPEEHRRIGDRLAGMLGCVHQVVLVGELASRAAEPLTGRMASEGIVTAAKWCDNLPGRVAAFVQSGDLVLLKGSRGMALERIAAHLRNVSFKRCGSRTEPVL